MKRLIISKNTFAMIPDNIEDEIPLMFQYRWSTKGHPDKSQIKAVVVYGDSPNLNAGGSDELGEPSYVNKTIEKIRLEIQKINPNAKISKYGFSAYSGGGIALYNLFKKRDKLVEQPGIIIASDANYGGKATAPVWTDLAKSAIKNDLKLIILHTQSLASQGSSTTQTTKHMLKTLGLENKYEDVSDFPEFEDWPAKPFRGVRENDLYILETKADHAKAGHTIPFMWNRTL